MADIYLIDGSSLVYRSFYAIRDLKTSTGQPTNAVYGFTSTLLKLLKDRKPDYVAVFLDMKAPTFRHEAFVEYKANRKPMPDELAAQLPLVKKVLEMFGIKFFELAGYEADDLIASSVKKLSAADKRIFIVTGDKDMLQLLDSNIFVLNPSSGSIMDAEKFEKEYGVTPEKITDIIGLAGDKSDNIPGIEGIGEKTALKLIREFGSTESIFENIEKVSPERLKKKLEAGREKVFLGKMLGTLVSDTPLDIDTEKYGTLPVDYKGLIEMFEKLEFRKLAASFRNEYFKAGEGSLINEKALGFSTGEIFNYDEIKNEPGRFKHLLESGETEKCGFDIKEKIVELEKAGIDFSLPFFDIGVARHLTGRVIEEKDIFLCRDGYIDELKKRELKKLFDEVEIPLVKTLAWLEINGIKADAGFLENFSCRLNKELEFLQGKIFGAAGESFNLNSTRQLAAILFEKLGLPAGRKTKTGFSTDNAVLKELSGTHPIVAFILQYRETYKLKSTYAEGLIPFISEDTGRIHPEYSQTATSTGRLSCSNPNLQNLPVRTELGSEIRKAFCAGGNNILYSFDYSQVELRILAHFSGDAYLVEAFKNGRDIHRETADILFAMDSLFSPQVETGGYKDTRRIAKTINFGVIYGMGPYALSQELGISLSEADNFIKEYFARFSGVKEYIDRTIRCVEEKGYVSTILKRRRYIDEVHSRNKQQQEFGRRAAINMPIQGSAADLIKLAMNRIYEYFHSKKLRSQMVLQVHDELLFEVSPEEERTVHESVKKIMEGAVNLKVPLNVDVKRGENYLEMEKL